MGLFKHETLEEKQERWAKKESEKKAKEDEKLHIWLNAHGLTGIRDDSLEQVKRIRQQLWGQNVGSLLADEKQVQKDIAYILLGITEQNWLLIKQNDQLRTQNDELIKLLKDKN